MANPTERVAFTRQAAVRISDAVRTVEGGNRSGTGLTFGRVAPPGVGTALRICTFTGSWAIDASKVVTFKNQTTTPNTVSATNLFAALETASGPRSCAIARDGTAWFLIAAECPPDA